MDDHTPLPQAPDAEERPVALVGAITRVEISLLPEIHDQLRALAWENGWNLEEATCIALHYGLSTLETPALATAYAARPPDDAPGQAHLPPAERLLANCRAMYAVMKYRAFKLQQQVQAQELQIQGLRGKEAAWERWAQQMRAQLDQARADSAPTPSAPEPAGASSASAPRWSRLWRRERPEADHD